MNNKCYQTKGLLEVSSFLKMSDSTHRFNSYNDRFTAGSKMTHVDTLHLSFLLLVPSLSSFPFPSLPFFCVFFLQGLRTQAPKETHPSRSSRPFSPPHCVRERECLAKSFPGLTLPTHSASAAEKRKLERREMQEGPWCGWRKVAGGLCLCMFRMIARGREQLFGPAAN